MKAQKPVVAAAAEVVEAEFERFAECMDLDLDESKMDADDLGVFKRQKDRILRAMSSGALVINEKGEAVYTPANPASLTHDPLTFHERTGASVMASDGHKKGYEVARTYAVMASMCETHPKTFSGLAGSDIKVCEALFALLMD